MNGVQYLQTIGDDGLPYLSAVDNQQFYYQTEPEAMSASMPPPVQVASPVYNTNKAIAPIAYREDPSTNRQVIVYSKNKPPAPVYYQEHSTSPRFPKESGVVVAPNIVVTNESNDNSSSSSSEDDSPPTLTTTTTTVKAAKRKRPTYNKPYVKSWFSGIPRLILIISLAGTWISAAVIRRAQIYTSTAVYGDALGLGNPAGTSQNSNYSDFESTRLSMLVFAIAAFIVSIAIYLLRAFNVIKLQFLKRAKPKFVFAITDLVFFICILILSIVCAVREGQLVNQTISINFVNVRNFYNSGAFAATAFFGFLSSICYLVLIISWSITSNRRRKLKKTTIVTTPPPPPYNNEDINTYTADNVIYPPNPTVNVHVGVQEDKKTKTITVPKLVVDPEN